MKQLDEFLLKNGHERLSQLQHKYLVSFAVSNQTNSTTVKARIRAMKKFFFLHLKDHLKVNIAKEPNQPKIPEKRPSSELKMN